MYLSSVFEEYFMIPRVKGTQDYIKMDLYNLIIEKIKIELALYNFTEIATPIIEPVSLFIRSLGEHTDVVSKEMFIIQSRNEEKEQICLRPEMTASTMRAFLQNNITQFPWHVFSHGPLFRYERPQKGRYRQFHQVNIESIGTDSISYDIQLILLLDRFFHERLAINNYVLQLNFLGCTTDRERYHNELYTFVKQQGPTSLCNTCITRAQTNLLRIFDCKQEACQTVYNVAPKITDHLCNDCQSDWEQLQNSLHMLSVSYICNPKLVRGLDYYNKTVFEFISNALGAQNAFCGGGRYNQLATQLGAKQDIPAIGAALGIERVILLLEQQQTATDQRSFSVIIPFGPAQHALALLLADELHAGNICVDAFFDGTMKQKMRQANAQGAAYVLLIGEDEQNENKVTVKNLQTGDQEKIDIIRVKEYLEKVK